MYVMTSQVSLCNPSLLVWLIGHANEATAVVEGVEMTVLVDIGSQISTHTKEFCSEFGLNILPLGGLLHLKGTGGIMILYKGYIEANLTIPGSPSIMRMCYF